MICEKCGKEHDGSFGSGRFCSRACANSRNFTKKSIEKKRDAAIRRVKEHGYWGRICYVHHRPKKVYEYVCKFCGKSFSSKDMRNIGGRSFCSVECSNSWRHEHTGGYREGSGRGKSGWYKGIFCGSTWELAFLIYHLDHDLKIERCTEKRKYCFEGRERTYLPDFVTDEGIVEIKGYNTEQWKAKHEANPDVLVLFKDDMKKYLDYVHNKYGSSLESLYDGSNPKLDLSKRKRFWIHKEKTNTIVPSEKLQEYLDKGFTLGQYIKEK